MACLCEYVDPSFGGALCLYVAREFAMTSDVRSARS